MMHSKSMSRLMSSCSWERGSFCTPISQDNLTLSSSSSSLTVRSSASIQALQSDSIDTASNSNICTNTKLTKSHFESGALSSAESIRERRLITSLSGDLALTMYPEAANFTIMNFNTKTLFWYLIHSILLFFKIDALLDLTLSFLESKAHLYQNLFNLFLFKVNENISSNECCINDATNFRMALSSSYDDERISNDISSSEDMYSSSESIKQVKEEGSSNDNNTLQSIREEVFSDSDISLSTATLIPAVDDDEGDDYGHFTDFLEPQSTLDNTLNNGFLPNFDTGLLMQRHHRMALTTLDTIKEDES